MVEKEIVIECKRWAVYCETCEKTLWEEDRPNHIQMIIARKTLNDHFEQTGRHHKVILVNFPYIN